MDNLSTITELIRDQLMNEYFSLEKEYYDNQKNINNNYQGDDINIDDEDNFVDENEELLDDETSDDYYDDSNEIMDLSPEEEEKDFDDFVFTSLFKKIINCKYKNIIYLIILQDVYENIKAEQISNLYQDKYKICLIDFLETWDIKSIFKKIETSIDFRLDLMILYFEYHCENMIEDRIKNKKIIELSGNQKNLDKFLVCNIDKLEYQYIKRRFN